VEGGGEYLQNADGFPDELAKIKCAQAHSECGPEVLATAGMKEIGLEGHYDQHGIHVFFQQQRH